VKVLAYDVTSLPIEWDYAMEYDAGAGIAAGQRLLRKAREPGLNTTTTIRGRDYILRFGRPPDISDRILLIQPYIPDAVPQYAALFIDATSVATRRRAVLTDLESMFRLVSVPEGSQVQTTARELLTRAPCVAFVRLHVDCPEDVQTDIEQLILRLGQAESES